MFGYRGQPNSLREANFDLHPYHLTYPLNNVKRLSDLNLTEEFCKFPKSHRNHRILIDLELTPQVAVYCLHSVAAGMSRDPESA